VRRQIATDARVGAAGQRPDESTCDGRADCPPDPNRMSPRGPGYRIADSLSAMRRSRAQMPPSRTSSLSSPNCSTALEYRSVKWPSRLSRYVA
jgi:hypothetical protein